VFELRLYLETSWPDVEKPLPDLHGASQVLLFLKFYDPATSTLRYMGHLFAPAAAQVGVWGVGGVCGGGGREGKGAFPCQGGWDGVHGVRDQAQQAAVLGEGP
jgi:hypothetical protein